MTSWRLRSSGWPLQFIASTCWPFSAARSLRRRILSERGRPCTPLPSSSPQCRSRSCNVSATPKSSSRKCSSCFCCALCCSAASYADRNLSNPDSLLVVIVHLDQLLERRRVLAHRRWDEPVDPQVRHRRQRDLLKIELRRRLGEIHLGLAISKQQQVRLG